MSRLIVAVLSITTLGTSAHAAPTVDALVGACDGGDSMACSAASLRFASGEGVPADERRARAYWLRALEPFQALGDAADRCLSVAELAAQPELGVAFATDPSPLVKARLARRLAPDFPDRAKPEACSALGTLVDRRDALDEARCEYGVAASCSRLLMAQVPAAKRVYLSLRACRLGDARACGAAADAFEGSKAGAVKLPVEETLALADALKARAGWLREHPDAARSSDELFVCRKECLGPPSPAFDAALARQKASLGAARR